MKKLALLTSILALTACGGGSGGGGATPGAIVTPTDDFVRVSADSGLSMVDVNAERVANYETALKTVNAIEYGHDISGSSAISRTSVSHRSSINSGAKLSYSADDVNSAYQIMHEILVSGDLDGKTNHDVLLALALSGMAERDIIDLLTAVNNSSSLTDNIKRFAEMLAADEKTEEINKIIARATSVYQDFGKEFTTTLENAKFSGNFSGGYFTFVFDENGKVESLKQIDGAEEVYASIGGGRFQQQKKGTEYRCEVQMDNQGNSIDAGVFFAANEKPTEAEIKERLLDALYEHVQNDTGGAIRAQIKAALDGMDIVGYNNWCDDCIISAPVDYSDAILVESRGKDLGLKYSDFGLVIESAIMHPGHVDIDDKATLIDKEITYHEHSVFAGGYEDKEANTPTTDMTFSGLAYAGVTTKRNDWTDAQDYQEPELAQYNGVATLSVSTADDVLTQKLVTDFSGDGWYTITVDDMGATNNDNIHFTGASKNPDFAYKTGNGDFENSGLKYYGPDADTPTEATGYIQYVERDENAQSDSDWGYKVDVAFGVKRD